MMSVEFSQEEFFSCVDVWPIFFVFLLCLLIICTVPSYRKSPCLTLASQDSLTLGDHANNTQFCCTCLFVYMIVLWKIHSPLQLIDSSCHQSLQVKCCRDFIPFDSCFNVLFFIYFGLTVFHLKYHRIDYIIGKKKSLFSLFKDYQPDWLIDYLLQRGKYAKQ